MLYICKNQSPENMNNRTKKLILIPVLSLGIFMSNAMYSDNKGRGEAGQQKLPQQAEVNELSKGTPKKTRSLLQYVEIWIYTSHCEVIFQENIETAIITICNSRTGDLMYQNTVNTFSGMIVDITLPPGEYEAYIISASGYSAVSYFLVAA